MCVLLKDRRSVERFQYVCANNRTFGVTHQGLFPAVTMSFNLQPGVALGDAVDEIDVAATKIGLPPTIHTDSQERRKRISSRSAVSHS